MERSYLCMPRKVIRRNNYLVQAVQDSDIESIRCWRNAQLDVLRQSKPITPKEQEAYYKRIVWPSMSCPYPENILLRYMKDGELIGYGGLVHIAWEHRRAEISFLLNPLLSDMKSKKYNNCSSTFLMLLKDIAFDDLNFERLYAETYAFRDYLISVLELNGFKREGVLKHHVLINNRPFDSIIHGCLKSYNR